MEAKRSHGKKRPGEKTEQVIMLYSDANYEPISDEQDPRDRYGYNPLGRGAGVFGSAGRRKAVRRFDGVHLLLIAATLALILLTEVLLADSRLFSVPARAAYTESVAAAADGPGDTPPSIAPVGSDGLEELSAEDIYDRACPVTVGVTIPGYTHNIFGQLSANVVTGTGIILSADGYILTNYHVVESAYKRGAEICVLTYDGRICQAEVVGSETDSDLVVLKIEAQELEPAVFGDSDQMRVGQTIYAVGNPLGELTYTMTGGIVSALDRSITTDVNVTVDMFQIDAAINSGNSGGPVFNRYGQVIGVVTAKYSLFGMEGLGFAIPANDACAIASAIIADADDTP